jgi:hypothetical protein
MNSCRDVAGIRYFPALEPAEPVDHRPASRLDIRPVLCLALGADASRAPRVLGPDRYLFASRTALREQTKPRRGVKPEQ